MPHLHHGASGSIGFVSLTALIVFAALVYLLGWLHLRSTSSSMVNSWHALSFDAGLLFVWVAIASPLSALDHELLTVHMLKHLLLMTLAPPLIWLGEPARCLAWAFPPTIWEIKSLRQIGRFLLKPEVCWLVAAAALIIWHIPPVFAVAMHSPVLHFVEQSSFLAAGLLFWWPVVQPWPTDPQSDLSIILYLFFATIPCDILAGLLVFCDRVVYADYLYSSHLFGFTTLGDQQCAAALMWTCVTLVYLVAGTVLAMRILSPKCAQWTPSAAHVRAARGSVQPSLEVF